MGLFRFLFLILLGLLAWFFFGVLLRLLGFGRRPQIPPARTREGEEMVRDPQCGLYLPRGDALAASVRGTTHYFCSETCRRTFEQGGGR